MSMDTRLRLEKFRVSWRGSIAVAEMDLSVGAGEVIGVFGHNGAGKSSLLLGVGGSATECSGGVALDGRALDRIPAPTRASLGIASSFQSGRVFPRLTVRENLRLARWRTQSVTQHEGWQQRILDAFPVLSARGETVARNLSGGERQILATAMALVREPRLLLLDEPLTGLSRGATVTLLDLVLSWVTISGCAVLVVEQRFEDALRICNRWLVLAEGKVVSAAASSAESVLDVRRAIVAVTGGSD